MNGYNASTFFTAEGSFDGIGNTNSVLGFSNLNQHGDINSYTFDASVATGNIVCKSYNELSSANKSDTSITNLYMLKDAFNVFMMRKSISLFEFLDSPIKDDETLYKTLDLLSYFSNIPFDPSDTVRSLVKKTSLDEEKAWLNSCLGSLTDTTKLDTMTNNIGIIIDLWIHTMKDLNIQEDILTQKSKKVEDIRKKISTIQILPVNELLVPVLDALQDYVDKEYLQVGLQDQYNLCLVYFKRIIIMQELMKDIRFFQDTSKPPLCPVCFDNTVNTCLVPCGHTFCMDCTGRDMRVLCPVCRSAVHKKQKMFFA